jgi:hypothetical protein
MAEHSDRFVADGGVDSAFITAQRKEGPLYVTGVSVFARNIGVLGRAGDRPAPLFASYAKHAGVIGTSRNLTGVAGVSQDRPGVYGQVEDAPVIPDGLRAGVLGAATTQPGVIGWSRSNDGVEGASFVGTAVRAVSFFGPGLHGLSGALTGVTGVSGAAVPHVSNIPNVAGVLGTSIDNDGVIGASKAQTGVFGYSLDGIGVVGQGINPGSLAGFFVGDVIVTGTLTANVKNGVVAFPDGSQRVLHCMESPEHWFEDFGTAKLKNGRAVVKLDAEFAKVIKPRDYRVFPAPEGDCNGLYVRSKGLASFEVRELNGGTSNAAFAYRIVGRRKDIRAHRRFARIDTRPPRPKAPPAPRKREPGAAAQRAFLAYLKNASRGKGAKKGNVGRADLG